MSGIVGGMDRTEREQAHRVVAALGCFVVEVLGGEPLRWEGFAMAQREADGAVTLAIYARECRSSGFPAASGARAFDLLVSAAQAERHVPAILGEWHPSSDNFKEYKRLRGEGSSQDAAAERTFTGRGAARHGYTRVVTVSEREDVVRIRFERGAGP